MRRRLSKRIKILCERQRQIFANTQNPPNAVVRSIRVELERPRRAQQRGFIDFDVAPESAAADQHANDFGASLRRKMSWSEVRFHPAHRLRRRGHQSDTHGALGHVADVTWIEIREGSFYLAE